MLGDPRMSHELDPVAEPSDTEATVVRSRAPATSATPVAPTLSSVEVRAPVSRTGANPLVAAAAPVLEAAMRIAGPPPDVEHLRHAMARMIQQFETHALATGLDTRSLRAARYALCATVDDIVLSTPWGSRSSWVQQSLTGMFHNEVVGGERFFEILEQMQHDLGRHSPVVELMYLCTSLGFEGRYRVMPRGVAALTELRNSVYRTIQDRRGEHERELSPHWRGIADARPWSTHVPLWAVGLGTATTAAVMYAVFVFLLASDSNLAFAELFGLQPKEPAVVAAVTAPGPTHSPAPAETEVARPSAVGVKLHLFLAPEIRAGLVQVLEDGQSVTVRLTNRKMFTSGNADLGPDYLPLLQRIGEALQDEPGSVFVNGYTDNQPIHTVRFPSNAELSQARAEAVAAVLRNRLPDSAARLHAQGKGEADPIATNSTPEGRQQNRRTEIVLIRQAETL
jgi:type VI secretion system protein ImpK